MTKIAIVIPAAGASRRMGDRDKLLELVDGAPLLNRIAQRALEVSETVLVTVPDVTSRRCEVLEGLDVRCIAVPDAADGMSASLRTAAATLQDEAHADIGGVMILPADMPDLTIDDLNKVISTFLKYDSKNIIQACGEDGTPGHPVLFPVILLPDFANLTGDSGAKSILRANREMIVRVRLPGTHAVTDLDTPEAWVTWRAKNADR